MTITLPRSAPPRPARVWRFFRTPKGLLLLLLVLLAALAVPAEGIGVALPGLLAATASAAVADLAIVRYRRKTWIFPDGAILSGLILALVLSPGEPWFVPIIAAVVGIAGKHLFRGGTANVFNPAALALVVAGAIFGSGQSWWGALPDLPPVALAVLFATGVFIANRINKLPLVLAFLGAYFALFTAGGFLADPARVAEVFRVPDLNAALFFAFFMLDDPPTCPVRYRDQVVFGLLVAVASFAIYLKLGIVYFLPAGLLLGNAWEAWRRQAVRGDRPRARPGAARADSG
jgi:Na+-translocating ferredoxin:NAD+ oxidoreductase RnfD subunit